MNETRTHWTGLKRDTVKLSTHQDEWDENARQTIEKLKQLLDNIAVDIQHIGSTAVTSIHAKPIIDIVIGVYNLGDISPYTGLLEQNNFIFRGEDIPGQILFVMGDFENDMRTHHIHVTRWNGTEWNNYISFRDYLNAFPEKAVMYDNCKQKLAAQFPDDRGSYTAGKQELIDWLANRQCLLAGIADILNVVLPAPFTPTIAIFSPFFTVKI